MSVSVVDSNSQTATIGTEHTLSTLTGAGVYQVVIDLSNMAGGATPDITEVRLYGKARSTDTERLIKCWSFQGVQSEALWFSPPLISPHDYKVTLKQIQGTGRAYPWAVYGI
ncbi:MAG: hypothetical protein GC190_21980 [Alphaproteobacteria bacterium]|nr:hypothetical protein [Alphaproteobacteria bacterium]